MYAGAVGDVIRIGMDKNCLERMIWRTRWTAAALQGTKLSEELVAGFVKPASSDTRPEFHSCV